MCSSDLDGELLELTDGVKVDDDGVDGDSRAVRPIEAHIITKQEAGGSVVDRKKALNLEIVGAHENGIIELFYKTDEQETWTQIPTADISVDKTHVKIRFPRGVQFKRIMLKAHNQELGQDLPLEGFVFEFENVPGRSGK